MEDIDESELEAEFEALGDEMDDALFDDLDAVPTSEPSGDFQMLPAPIATHYFACTRSLTHPLTRNALFVSIVFCTCVCVGLRFSSRGHSQASRIHAHRVQGSG